MRKETYTSPSGLRYEVFPQTRTRMAGGFLEDCEMYPVEYTEYEIFLDGKKVQFAFSEEGIADSVKHFEQPGWDGWTTSVYD
jgi:hypothetical protein